ncbi:hypothetical protein [Endozoicomonas euniceicola]|uniref:Uracil-DNA glycosylase-like domain-containing protein n=1 Tax=Endozoicomonas euniceicola TaxID=1234143 RepID=A0ABY6GV70_9GAMM|nr:hypothetical protein [Endozoicomonas euniceicola]UYM15859.1 hypothetical protein NX720_24055 [Endozoicomonas euniceicola]
MMLEELKQIALDQNQKLITEYPRQEGHGGLLFLGQHYASSNILFLGLAPLIDDDSEFNANPLNSNILLEGPSKRRYFRNASFAFKQNEQLQHKLEKATFCYCSPFKTKKWTELSLSRQNLFLEHSRPILNTIVEQCQPEFLIVSGQETVDILSGYFGDIFTDFNEIENVDMDRSHRWTEYLFKINGRPSVLIKAPNFSYASNKEKLFHLSNWLLEKISRSPYR